MNIIICVALTFLWTVIFVHGGLLSKTVSPVKRRNAGRLEDTVSEGKFEKMFDSLLSKYKSYLYPDTVTDVFDFSEFKVTSTLLSLVELDYVDERLSTVVEFTFHWIDERLRWNDVKYGVRLLPVDAKLVWKPTMKIGNRHVSNRARADDEEDVVYVISTGEVIWTFVKIIDTRCEVDTTYFPFDKQFCHIDLKFPLKARLALLNFNHTIHDDAKENGNWRLSNHAFRHEFTNTLYQTVIIEYEFDRKPTNAFITLIIPVFILVSIVPLVFILPKENGDRLGLTVTVLLAVSVYMTLVTDKLPSSSEPIPLITIILFIWYNSNALVLIIVLIDAKIYHMNDKRPVPVGLKRFVQLTRRIFCQSETPKEKETEVEEDPKLKNEQESAMLEDHEENKIAWKHVSVALDKWAFVIIYILKIIFAVTMFCVVYNGDNDKKSQLKENHKD